MIGFARSAIGFAVLSISTAGAGAVAARAADEPVDYLRDVKPILAKRCYSCHGEDDQKSGLRLDQRGDALAGGDRGTAIEPGRADESRLIQYITGMNDDEITMPPDDEQLPPAQIKLLRRWIDEGAAWPDE